VLDNAHSGVEDILAKDVLAANGLLNDALKQLGQTWELEQEIERLEAEVVRLRQLEDLCRRWFTDDDLSVHAGALHEEIMAWFASPDKPPEPDEMERAAREGRIIT